MRLYLEIVQEKRRLLVSRVCLNIHSGRRVINYFCCTIPGGGVLPYMGYIGKCSAKGYGFLAVLSEIGNQF